jgi:hypothetical protein
MHSPVSRSVVYWSIAASGLLVSGCGGGEHFDVAPVTGKVICSGKPVAEGLVQFAPVADKGNGASNKAARPGKSGAGEIKPDGTFAISTYELGDGAIVGKCRVMAGPSDPTKPWACKMPGPIEFEVKPGANSIVIELDGDKGSIKSDTAG